MSTRASELAQELAQNWRKKIPVKGRQRRVCANYAPKGALKLAQHSTPGVVLVRPGAGISAVIGAELAHFAPPAPGATTSPHYAPLPPLSDPDGKRDAP